jgi:hypothetical protein
MSKMVSSGGRNSKENMVLLGLLLMMPKEDVKKV